LFEQCAAIFNIHVDWALEHHTYNKSKAHEALYAKLREQYPDIPSALIQAIRDTAMEAVKATKFEAVPHKKPHSGLRYDRRTLTLRGHQLTLSCMGKRVRVILDVPAYFREIVDTWKLKGAMLTYRKHAQRFWIHLVFEAPTPEKQTDGEVQGIDRGLYHLAVTSDQQFFSNQNVRAVQRRYHHTRRSLQLKGTRSAKRRLRALSGREKRFKRDVNHCVTKALVQQDTVMTFVLEDLSGIRNQRRGKKMNKQLNNWTFHQFEQCLEYKAEAVGKTVAYVDARYTSQRCSQCGHIYKKNRHKSRYHCVRCGLDMHADVNAAINIQQRYLLSVTHGSTEQAVVNQPPCGVDMPAMGYVECDLPR
jgi:IS605 OrfB family transposase